MAQEPKNKNHGRSFLLEEICLQKALKTLQEMVSCKHTSQENKKQVVYYLHC